jgi:hypothetical protein
LFFSSLIKHYDIIVNKTIQKLDTVRKVNNGITYGTLSNGGVEIAPFFNVNFNKSLQNQIDIIKLLI